MEPGSRARARLHGARRRALCCRPVRRRGHIRGRGGAQPAGVDRSSSASRPSSRPLWRRGQVARSNLRLDAGLNRLRDIVMLLSAEPPAPCWSRCFVCLLLLADDDLDLGDVLVAAGPLLIGDIIGIAVITPVALRLALRPLRCSIACRCRAGGARPVRAVAAALWVILGAAGPGGTSGSICCSFRSWSPPRATGSTAPASASPSPSSA